MKKDCYHPDFSVGMRFNTIDVDIVRYAKFMKQKFPQFPDLCKSQSARARDNSEMTLIGEEGGFFFGGGRHQFLLANPLHQFEFC